MNNPIAVSKKSFRPVVLESDKLVLVDFWAAWCGPCKKLGPVLDEIAKEMGDKVQIAKVDVDKERELGAMFQIMSIPTVLLYKNGKKVDEFVGGRSKSDIVAMLKKHL